MKEADEESLKAFLSVGEIAKRSGVAISAIHFYENKGLIKAWRNSGNQRVFPRGMLRVVSFIKVAQSLGLSLSEIEESLSCLPKNQMPSPEDWNKLSLIWKKILDERIENLLLLRDQLDKCIGCGCLSLSDCPLRNPKDQLAKCGSGAHLLYE